MKGISIKKKIFVGALGSCVCGFALLGVHLFETHTTVAETALIGIQETYFVDDIISMPTSLSTPNGIVDASVKVVHPDGSEITGDTVEFSSPGIYTFVYTANNGAVSDQTEVTVAYPLYEMNLGYATAEYSAEGPFGTQKAYPGIFVTLPENAKFTYNRVVDLSNKTKEDLIYSGNIVANSNTDCDF